MEPDGFPMLQITKLTFSDGTTLNVKDDDVILLVGPNNSGKSACLRELRDIIVRGPWTTRQVIKDATVVSPQTLDEIKSWLDKNVKTDKDGIKRLPYVGRVSDYSVEKDWEQKADLGLREIGSLLTLHLTTEERLNAANPINSIDFGEEVETHPFHKLFIDEDFERHVDNLFHRTFGEHLVVNRNAGPKIKLHVAHTIPNEREFNRRQFSETVNSLPALHEQGDGVRSFVGVLISILASRRRVILLDEPEAFLHPPQAFSLGKLLAHHLPKGRQLFIATHSADIVKGLLDDPTAKVRVIRIRREGSTNRIHELDPARVREIFSSPLLRYSGILDGLFHDGVIVCEGDTDCLFYSAITDIMSSDESQRNIIFVHGGGKDRISAIVSSLRAVGVPVKAIADFDILAEEAAVKRIVEAFDADWGAFKSDWKVVKEAIDKVRAQKSVDDIRNEINQVLDDVKGHNLTEVSINSIKKIVRQGSGWIEAKRLGKRYIPSGSESECYERLEIGLSKIGLFVVPVGEVEGFDRMIDGKGPKWALKVLECDIAQSPNLAEAREFCLKITNAWT